MKKVLLGTLAVMGVLAIATTAFASGPEAIFPEGFLWGTATSSYQVEGGIYNNDWYEFEKKKGRIENNDKCGAACDHYNRYKEDLDLALALNTKIYRMSIEWARIEPAEGKFDAKELAHYRDVLTEVKKRGMIPFVTIFHFCTPTWLSKKGAWASDRTPEYFARYAGYLAQNLGDLVDYWTTQNETMGYLTTGYLAGKWAPGYKNPIKFYKGMANSIKGHGAAYRIIKQLDTIDCDGDGKPALVGIVTNYAVIDPYKPDSALNRFLAEKINYLLNHVFIDAITTGGKFAIEGIEQPKKKRGKKGLAQMVLPQEPNTLDFIGVNYYTRFLINLSITHPIIGLEQVTRTKVDPKKNDPAAQFETNDMGWLIYPEGIYRAVTAVKKYGIPIYITENGIPDKTDKRRAKYIADHLIQLKRAIDDGAPVKGYIHWALIDNFEWAEGYWPKFGLYDVDYATQKRSLNEGGAFYAEVCRNNGVTAKMFDALCGARGGEEEKAKSDQLFNMQDR